MQSRQHLPVLDIGELLLTFPEIGDFPLDAEQREGRPH
jgi:hypothetical protein